MKPVLVFDLDGTLLDTLASLAEAYNLALKDLGFPPHATDAYRMIIGDGAFVAARRALPQDRKDDQLIAQCVDKFRHYYDDLWRTASPYPGIKALLATLRGDYTLTVLSNKDEAFTRQCCDTFFPGVFELTLGASDMVKHKPDPSGPRAIARHYGREPNQLWMIGDTATDMKTAAATGMTGVGVLWGFRDRVELLENGAHHLLHEPAELLALLRAGLL